MLYQTGIRRLLNKTRVLKVRTFCQTKPVLQAMADIEAGKKAAAEAAINEHVQDNQVIGIGSGTTIISAVSRLAQRVKDENLKVVCIPTSFQAKQLILDNNLVLGTLEQHPKIDVAIDGADEVDSDLNCIKGGGGCLLQEKIIASCASTFVIIADSRKDVESLGTTWKKGIPMEVVGLAYKPIQMKIAASLGGEATLRMASKKMLDSSVAYEKTASLLAYMGEEATLRMASKKMGPVVTDNGNFILDWCFDKPADWAKVNTELLKIPGLIETGLFVNMAKMAYFGPYGPVVTDNGNFILDWCFDKPADWAKVNTELLKIPGLIETGLFVNMAKMAYFGQPDGSVKIRKANA